MSLCQRPNSGGNWTKKQIQLSFILFKSQMKPAVKFYFWEQTNMLYFCNIKCTQNKCSDSYVGNNMLPVLYQLDRAVFPCVCSSLFSYYSLSLIQNNTFFLPKGGGSVTYLPLWSKSPYWFHGEQQCSPDWCPKLHTHSQKKRWSSQVEPGWQLQCITTQLGAHSTRISAGSACIPYMLYALLTCRRFYWGK